METKKYKIPNTWTIHPKQTWKIKQKNPVLITPVMKTEIKMGFVMSLYQV